MNHEEMLNNRATRTEVSPEEVPSLDWLHLSPRSSLEFKCPYCGKNLMTWNRGKESNRPLITDGDIVYGVAEAIGWNDNKPWDFSLCSTAACESCGNEGFLVYSCLLAEKYTHESRLLFNADPGDAEYFKCLVDQLRLIELELDKKLYNWQDYVGYNDGCWNIVEYKTATLHPMQWHLIGPFRADMENIRGSYGVTACTLSGTSEWGRAKTILVTLWDTFKELAEIRQRQWEKSTTV